MIVRTSSCTIVLLSCFMLVAPVAGQGSPAVSPSALPEDVASTDAIITAFYDEVSGPAGQERDWDRLRSLFLPGATLTSTAKNVETGEVAHRLLDVEGYIARNGPMLERNGFFVREIGRGEERFGNIVHAFSAYDARRLLSDAAPIARGVNSIQLYNDGARWWIVSILWDSERPDNPIPDRYIGSR